MKCQDCIHFDVCEYHITEMTQMSVNECTNFKPKSRFIELPCEIGQKIWAVGCRTGIAYPLEVFGVWVSADEHNIMTNQGVLLDKNYYLTKEEAEKALKEKSNNNCKD